MVPIRPVESASCKKGKKDKKEGPRQKDGTPLNGQAYRLHVRMLAHDELADGVDLLAGDADEVGALGKITE